MWHILHFLWQDGAWSRVKCGWVQSKVYPSVAEWGLEQSKVGSVAEWGAWSRVKCGTPAGQAATQGHLLLLWPPGCSAIPPQLFIWTKKKPPIFIWTKNPPSTFYLEKNPINLTLNIGEKHGHSGNYCYLSFPF